MSQQGRGAESGRGARTKQAEGGCSLQSTSKPGLNLQRRTAALIRGSPEVFLSSNIHMCTFDTIAFIVQDPDGDGIILHEEWRDQFASCKLDVLVLL